ncbi:hypothetical protein FA048_11235 [Pedobacter polaris]|uniref:Carboxypeptidase regulatory-like domain-containing protein n=1 Tax=Pedobacter polaris TaxID=2571273 RepID=A0A4U1CRG5_9SPHI|nr:carboxypeptidase-like regulatory domain-containing protein [Pedobacter polaris]TKC10737.1 hypothetical protein FA048_11235 [Pedobacter polaris]
MQKNHLKALFYLVLFVLTFFQTASAQIINQRAKIIKEYDSIRKVAPREKLYIHFDKTTYLPQDTIWFKGYLVNATLNSYSQLSGLIYTEMINANGEVVETLSLPTALGLTWGAFALKEERYPPGNYIFRAYTNWIMNFGDTYIFKKEIKILSVDAPIPIKVVKGQITTEKKPSTPTTNKSSKSEIDIQFLPESGSWLADLQQKMAFKAIDKAGKGIEVKGEILDSRRNKITSFKSNSRGMGYFTMVPQSTEVYTAVVADNFSFTKVRPKPQLNGTTIQLGNTNKSDSLSITLISTLQNQPLTLVGQARGVLCFIAHINANVQRKTIKVSKNIFPTGVAQIVLMNDKKQVLNERNFFLNFNDQLQVKTSSKVLTYGVRDSIPIQINVTDITGKPVAASFSMVVTDDNQVTKDTLNDENILTYLLMTADLKGEIEKPGYYFNQKNEQTFNDLDALMLTQGWVSYNWNLSKKPIFKAEKEYTISGKVTNIMNKPSTNAKITMLGKNKPTVIMDTLTNQNGEFVFDKLPLLDSSSFIIQALNAKGKTGTLGIEVNTFERPSINIAKKNIDEENEIVDSIAVERIATKNQVYQAALKNGILLREVKITGKKVIRGSKNLNGAGMASQILTEESLAPIYKKTLLQALQEKVKGFREGTRRKSNIRDFFVNSDQAKFIFDGIEIDFFYSPSGSSGNSQEYYDYVKAYLDYYNAEDIRGIEVLSDGYSFKYKSEFMHPMDERMYSFIEITTKTGAGPFLKKSANIYLLKPINYGSNKMFYSPRYTSATKTDKYPDYRSTIYWNPNILTNTTGEAHISFFSADKKGTYTVWLEGTDTEGNLGFSTLKLTIK